MTDGCGPGPGSPAPPSSNRELIADRQATDTLAGGREDRVTERRREGRDAGLADTARGHVDSVLDDVHAGLGRRFVNPGELEVVEVALFDPAVLVGNLAVLGEGQAHHRRALDLRADPIRIDCVTAINRCVDPGDGETALLVHRHLHNRRNIAHEAAVGGYSQSAALRHLTTPPGALRRNVDDVPQASGIDWIGPDWLAVVPVRRRDLFAQINDARWTDQLQQEFLGITSQFVGNFRNQGLGAERMRNVVHGPEPANPGARLRFSRFDAQVGDVEWRIDQSEPELDEEGELRVRREG